jgi:hypothetical protein
MATKKSGTDPTKEVRNAWKDAQHAWRRVEDSLAHLVESDKVLIQKLRKAGKSMTRNAKTEINAIVRTVDRKRKVAITRFEKITGHKKALAKR